jgi:hypothetical protein
MYKKCVSPFNRDQLDNLVFIPLIEQNGDIKKRDSRNYL